MLENSGASININCIDPLGRTALLMAIDNENLEMIDLLLEFKVETKDALLHAIHEEYVEAVEVLLDHEESIHRDGEPWVRMNISSSSSKMHSNQPSVTSTSRQRRILGDEMI